MLKTWETFKRRNGLGLLRNPGKRRVNANEHIRFANPLDFVPFLPVPMRNVDVQILDHNGVNKTIQNIYTKKWEKRKWNKRKIVRPYNELFEEQNVKIAQQMQISLAHSHPNRLQSHRLPVPRFPSQPYIHTHNRVNPNGQTLRSIVNVIFLSSRWEWRIDANVMFASSFCTRSRNSEYCI